MRSAKGVNSIAELYGAPAPETIIRSREYCIKEQKMLLQRDIKDICTIHNIQFSDIVSGCRYREVQLAKEKICVIAGDRLGHLMSAVEIATVMNLPRSTMLTAVDRWRIKNYGEAHKRDYKENTVRGYLKNSYVPKGQGCPNRKEKKARETKD